MRIAACIVVTCLTASVGCNIVAADTVLVENETEFLKRCREEVLRSRPDAAPWVDRHCVSKWRRAENAASMAEAILALAPTERGAPLSREEARARLPMVQWSSGGTEGRLDDAAVQLPDAGIRIGFNWRKPGSEAPYNIIDALRIRGVTLRTLGCPQYPGASMGREKVMLAELAGRLPFTLTVYSRPAPTGIEPGLYEVDADFGESIPDMAALRAGRYPGGGGRAFAVDPVGWVTDCPDPE